jgi:hypothetical protein
MVFLIVAAFVFNCCMAQIDISKLEGANSTTNAKYFAGVKKESKPPSKYLLTVKDTRELRRVRKKRKSLKPGPAVVSPLRKKKTKKSKDGAANTSTLHQKIVFGYQGWFCTDKAANNLGWTHWSKGTPPSAMSANFDLFPDVSDYPVCALSNNTLLINKTTGNSMHLYDSLEVIDVHFSWMAEYGIHGVAVQRFVSQLAVPRLRDRNDRVLLASMLAAERYSRAFFVEYDTSGADANTWSNIIQTDWEKLTKVLNVTSSPAYQREGNKPVLKVFGIGFLDRPGNHSDSLTLVNSLKAKGVIFIGSVPTFWRDGVGDSKSGYGRVYKAMDVISPWLVGRYSSTAKFDDLFYGVFLKDLRLTSSRQQGYAPTVFPGFSWTNLQRNKGRNFPLNQIPRNGGRFWEYQVNAFMKKLVDTNTGSAAYYIFGAMFDEFDESTAMIKSASTSDNLPLEGSFLHLSIDGDHLPSDHYLYLAGKYSLEFSRIDRNALIPIATDRVFVLSTSQLSHYQLLAKQIESLRQTNSVD